MLPDKDKIKNYYIYTYTFIDDLSYIKNPYEYFQYEEKEKIDEVISLIKKRFLDYGWEGDGEIGIIWIPPFIDIGAEDTWGTYIWHVKQNNNGISYLASDYPLNYERLEEHKVIEFSDKKENITPHSIIQTCVDWFSKAVVRIETELRDSIEHLTKENELEIVKIIKENLTINYQGILVRYFQEFLEECYLQFLINAIEDGNPYKIKLRKCNIKVDAYNYIPEPSEEEDEYEDNISTPIILRGFIRDMWKAFKWEPYKVKIDMLFKSIDYESDEAQIREIKKHVILRNCIQHHEGCLDQDAINQLGCSKLEMRDKDNNYYITVWNPIKFSEYEIYFFCSILKEFVNNFHEYVKKQVPKLYYLHQPI